MSQEEARKSAIAKAGRRLIPFLCLCYAVNFLDRVNVGFAALDMNQDLGFSPSVFGAGAGIFFAGYILFEGAEQSGDAEIRRARLDRAHHDQLGDPRHRHGLRQRRDQLLCHAVSAGRGGSRLLSRNNPLSHLLVPGAGARAHHLSVHGGGAARHHGRRPRVGRAARNARAARAEGLALAVHHRRLGRCCSA